jgi:hypothetical protein
VTVVGRAFLAAVRRAFRAVDVENDHLRRFPRVHPIDPGPRQIGQRPEIVRVGQPSRLEAAHLADRCGGAGETSPIDDGAHRWIDGEPFGIVHILIAGETAVDRLPQQPGQDVSHVPAAPQIRHSRPRRRRQIESLVQLAIGEQPGVRGDLAAVEFELQAVIEIELNRIFYRFTRWMNMPEPPGDSRLIAIHDSPHR